jgi:hypothetical protein
VKDPQLARSVAAIAKTNNFFIVIFVLSCGTGHAVYKIGSVMPKVSCHTQTPLNIKTYTSEVYLYMFAKVNKHFQD